MIKKKILVSVLPFLIATSSYADSQLQSLENISQELVKIRQEIENLHNQISFEKDAYKDQLRSYASQKSDLEVRISRSDLNIKDLQRELKKLTDVNKDKEKSRKILNPILEVAIDQLRENIRASLPFKLEQRLQVLNDIEQRLHAGIISPNKAANQLWAYVEDELMLGRSSGIYNETMNIDGRDKLVKALRIGKIAMFYKTQDDQFGVIKKQGNEWQQQAIVNSERTAQLQNLFDSFSKNIRNGQFHIPNFLPKS